MKIKNSGALGSNHVLQEIYAPEEQVQNYIMCARNISVMQAQPPKKNNFVTKLISGYVFTNVLQLQFISQT